MGAMLARPVRAYTGVAQSRAARLMRTHDVPTTYNGIFCRHLQDFFRKMQKAAVLWGKHAGSATSRQPRA